MRAQLTTINSQEGPVSPSQVNSEVVPFLLLGGGFPPIFFLDRDLHAAHIEDLRQFGEASLATGHITSPTTRRTTAAGWRPSRAVLLGQTEPVADAEVRVREFFYFWERGGTRVLRMPPPFFLFPWEALTLTPFPAFHTLASAVA